MCWDQPFYFSNSHLQLELNLNESKRYLIQMIDQFEADECFQCNSLKCKCDKENDDEDAEDADGKSIYSDASSMTVPDGSQESVEQYFDVSTSSIAPPAETLPLPEWINHSNQDASGTKNKDEEWVRASTSLAETTPSTMINKEWIQKDTNIYSRTANYTLWNEEPKLWFGPKGATSSGSTVDSFFQSFGGVRSDDADVYLPAPILRNVGFNYKYNYGAQLK